MAVSKIYRRGLLNKRKKIANEAELRSRIACLDSRIYRKFKKIRKRGYAVIFIEDLQRILKKCGYEYTISGLRRLIKAGEILQQPERSAEEHIHRVFLGKDIKGYKAREKWFRNRIIFSQIELIMWLRKLLKEGMEELEKRSLTAKEIRIK